MDNAATYLKAWYRFGDTHDFDGNPYSFPDSLGQQASDFTNDTHRINDRSGKNNHLATIDLGMNNPVVQITSDTFSTLNVQKAIYKEAIEFPSISEIVGV